MKHSHADRGLAVIPLVIIVILVGLAGFSLFSWLSTRSAAEQHRRSAEEREKELKTQYEAVKKEAEDSAAEAAELADSLKKTEEAMRLAEEKAQKDAEEKAAMIEELNTKLEAEEKAKVEAEERSLALEKTLSDLEESIRIAENREEALRSRLASGDSTYGIPAASSFESMRAALRGQQAEIDSMRDLLASGQPVAKSQLAGLVSSFESKLAEGEGDVKTIVDQLVKSGRYSRSSKVGQAVSDLQQSTDKQRSLLDALKSMLASSGDQVDAAQLQALLNDLEATSADIEAHHSALTAALEQEMESKNVSSSDSGLLAELQTSLTRQRAEVENIRRELAQANAERDAAIERQKQLERLSIEVRYDIDYQVRSVNYKRRLHSMYDRVANPAAEK